MSPFCIQCGASIKTHDKFCDQCGTQVQNFPAIADDPAQSWFERGFSYEQASQFDLAIMAYSKSIEQGIEPECYMALLNRGILLLNLKRYEEAKIDLLQYVKFSPQDVYPLIYLSSIYRIMGDSQQSQLYLDQAKVIDSQTVEIVLKSIEICD